MVFNLGSFFGSSGHDKKEGYQEFEKYNNKELALLAKKNLNRIERAKFEKTMEGKIKIGREMSAHKITKAIGADYNFRFKQTIKKKMFTEKPESGLTDRQIERNLLVAKYNRMHAEEAVAHGRDHQTQEYHSATAPVEAPRSSFFQADSTEPEANDHPTNQPLAGPPA